MTQQNKMRNSLPDSQKAMSRLQSKTLTCAGPARSNSQLEGCRVRRVTTPSATGSSLWSCTICSMMLQVLEEVVLVRPRFVDLQLFRKYGFSVRMDESLPCELGSQLVVMSVWAVPLPWRQSQHHTHTHMRERRFFYGTSRASCAMYVHVSEGIPVIPISISLQPSVG